MHRLLTSLCVILVLSSAILADNVVDIGISHFSLTDSDTMYGGKDVAFEIYYENDESLGGLSTGFVIWSPDGAHWQWQDVGGYGASGAVTVNPCSRLYPPEQVLNLGGMQVLEKSCDNILPDSILVGGSSLSTGMAAGPLQHMISLNGHISASSYEVTSICIDSAKVGPGDFIFVGSSTIIPIVGWNEGGICYPIVVVPCMAVVVESYTTNWIQADPLETVTEENVVTFIDPASSSYPVYIALHEVQNGSGNVVVTDNGDHTCDISYTPSPADGGHIVGIEVMAYGQYCVKPINTFTLYIEVGDYTPVFRGTIDISNSVGDTFSYGDNSAFLIDIEDSVTITGIMTGFKIWSPDNAFWYWHDLNGLGASECVRVMPGSRLDPHMTMLDPNGLQVDEYGFDAQGVDTIVFSGSAEMNGIAPGAMQSMIALNFVIDSYTPEGITTICMDSCTSLGGNQVIFIDAQGTYIPAIGWSEGGRCYPAKKSLPTPELQSGVQTALTDVCTPVTVEDAATWTLSGGGDISISLFGIVNGAGEASIVDNGDGTCDITYTPIPADSGQIIDIIIQALSDNVYSNLGELHTLSVTIGNSPPSLDCGQAVFNIPPGISRPKTDISATDCPGEELTFSLISGPGAIDPETGVYLWTPDEADTGLYTVTIAVSDAVNSPVEGSFQVNVTELPPGDINGDGNANIGDAVYMVLYIFKGGPAPVHSKYADVNNDCTVNIADVVYIVNYIFRDGNPPVISDCEF
ncbi:MAG: dockerin type I domain-containing protein [Candidatus Zixiibacteriota bacterium]